MGLIHVYDVLHVALKCHRFDIRKFTQMRERKKRKKGSLNMNMDNIFILLLDLTNITPFPNAQAHIK